MHSSHTSIKEEKTCSEKIHFLKAHNTQSTYGVLGVGHGVEGTRVRGELVENLAAGGEASSNNNHKNTKNKCKTYQKKKEKRKIKNKK